MTTEALTAVYVSVAIAVFLRWLWSEEDARQVIIYPLHLRLILIITAALVSATWPLIALLRLSARVVQSQPPLGELEELEDEEEEDGHD